MELGEREIFPLMMALENVVEIKEAKRAVCIEGNGAAYFSEDAKSIPRGLVHSGCRGKD